MFRDPVGRTLERLAQLLAILGGLALTGIALMSLADRYSALGFAYALAAVVAGFVPALTGALGAATANAWWHPAIVLAGMSLITFVASLVAIRIRVDRDDAPDAVPTAAETAA